MALTVAKIKLWFVPTPAAVKLILVTDVTPDTGVSKDDLYAMVGDPKYGKDMAFTRKVEKMFQNAFGDQAYAP